MLVRWSEVCKISEQDFKDGVAWQGICNAMKDSLGKHPFWFLYQEKDGHADKHGG